MDSKIWPIKVVRKLTTRYITVRWKVSLKMISLLVLINMALNPTCKLCHASSPKFAYSCCYTKTFKLTCYDCIKTCITRQITHAVFLQYENVEEQVHCMFCRSTQFDILRTKRRIRVAVHWDRTFRYRQTLKKYTLAKFVDIPLTTTIARIAKFALDEEVHKIEQEHDRQRQYLVNSIFRPLLTMFMQGKWDFNKTSPIPMKLFWFI
mgnify:CR=1 FL=1